MPSFVIIISLLSFLSFIYALNILSKEAQRMQFVTRPFGGGFDEIMEQALRLSLATLLAIFATLTLLMSAALVWLATQPGLVG